MNEKKKKAAIGKNEERTDKEDFCRKAEIYRHYSLFIIHHAFFIKKAEKRKFLCFFPLPSGSPRAHTATHATAGHSGHATHTAHAG